MTTSTLVYLLSGVMLNAIAQLALKAATVRLGGLFPEHGGAGEMLMRIAVQPGIWLGLACYALSVLVWVVALSRTEVSVAYPFLSIGYVLTALLAWPMFGETLTAMRIAAIVLICAGVILLHRS